MYLIKIGILVYLILFLIMEWCSRSNHEQLLKTKFLLTYTLNLNLFVEYTTCFLLASDPSPGLLICWLKMTKLVDFEYG